MRATVRPSVRRILVGVYRFGSADVRLYADPQMSGGSFAGRPREMTVGLKSDWLFVCQSLVHEAMELAFSDLGLRYVPDVDAAGSSDGYFFACDHAGFSEAAARVGHLAGECLPALSRAYRAASRGRKG